MCRSEILWHIYKPNSHFERIQYCVTGRNTIARAYSIWHHDWQEKKLYFISTHTSSFSLVHITYSGSFEIIHYQIELFNYSHLKYASEPLNNYGPETRELNLNIDL